MVVADDHAGALMLFAHGVTVTRLRAPLVADPYSGAATKRDWSAAVSVSIEGCAVAPGGSSEVQGVNREQVTTEPTLYAPYGADVLPWDRILDPDGVTWEVVARGGDWRSPFTGWEAGSVFPLRRVEG